MSALILNGIEVSIQIEQKLKEKIIKLKQKNIIPGLAVILVGDDKPSQTYVNLKHKKCEELGIFSKIYKFDENIEEQEIINLIQTLNNDDKINGILLQLPLPKKFDVSKITDAISYLKDVDGFHPLNFGYLALNRPLFIPCTPYGVIKLLEHYKINVTGKNAVIVGCSNIVGKPMGLLLQFCETATCTICHILTKNLKEKTREAEILISAAGKPNLITADMVKENAIVIDIGFNVTECQDNKGNIIRKVCGDVDFENVKNIV